MLRGHDPNPNACMQILFTGVPGIGKSIFMIYFLCKRFLDKRFADKSFATEFRSGEYNVFRLVDSDKGEYRCQKVSNTSSDFAISELLVCADIRGADEPANHTRCTLIFSSPNPSRYKQFMKASASYRYYIPTWSENEFSFLKCSWHDRFVRCGGIPRIILWGGRGLDPLIGIDSALQAKGAHMADNFFNDGHGGLDNEIYYHLVHINPPKDENGEYIYDAKEPIYTFASDSIFRSIVEKYENKIINSARDLFNLNGGTAASTKFGAVSAGHIFEQICLWLAPLAEKTISSDKISKISALPVGDEQFGSISFPQMSILTAKWKAEKKLSENVLYQPSIANMESGDAFCVIPVKDGNYMLIVLQVTVGESHPIKTNGLKVIVEAFPRDIKDKFVRKIILFVIPKDGKLKGNEQEFHNQQGRPITKDKIPLAARDFEQWVYQHEI